MRKLAFALLVTLAAFARAEFVPPAEGPVPFRRDKLPVDVDTIAALSRQVTVLAGAGLPADAAGRRTAAQIAALALALDPANRPARDLLDRLKAGEVPAAAEGGELQRSRSRIWQTLAWLEMPEAGADGRALAACLTDVLVIADPDHPRAREQREGGEIGRWTGWVAPESAFREKAPEPDPEPMPEKEEAPLPAVALAEVSTPVPVWTRDKNKESPSLRMALLRAKVSPGSESGGVEIRWQDALRPGLTPPSRAVAAAVAKRHDGLKGGLTADFTCRMDGTYDPAGNGGTLSGSAAVLLEAALSGNSGPALAFAVAGEDGSLSLPPAFWSALRALAASEKGHRIILPAKAENFLPSLLLLDGPDFFMENEVLLAGTVEELCSLAAGKPDPALAESLAAFAEIRAAGEGKAIGPFLAHPSTQARLNKLASAMPRHASARMLALQGSGSRPRFLPRPVLAREIRNALQPIGYLREETGNELLTARLDEIHAGCREQLDGLFGFIEIRDRDLHKSAVAVADSIRTLARLLDREDRDYPYELRLKQTEARRATWTEYLAVLAELTEAAGDGTEYVLPKPFGQR